MTPFPREVLVGYLNEVIGKENLEAIPEYFPPDPDILRRVHLEHEALLQELRQGSQQPLSIHIFTALGDPDHYDGPAMASLECYTDWNDAFAMMIHVHVRLGRIIGYGWMIEPLERV